MTRYAHPAPSLDILQIYCVTVSWSVSYASAGLCGCARPCSRCLSNGNVPWYHTVDIQSLIHQPGTLTRPRHTIFVRRAAPFLPLKMANLGRLRNLLSDPSATYSSMSREYDGAACNAATCGGHCYTRRGHTTQCVHTPLRATAACSVASNSRVTSVQPVQNTHTKGARALQHAQPAVLSYASLAAV